MQAVWWLATLLVASTAAIPSTPWPLPLNLTRGPASATVDNAFFFFCDPDPACSASCTTSPLVADAFSRFEARLRPPPGAVESPSYWWRYPGADCDGVQYDLGKNCGVDVSGCEASCAATAGCAGFNTNGVMKNASCGASGSILPGAGCGGCVDLYLLKDTPEPTSGVLTSVAVCVASGDESLGQATDESYTLVAPSNGTGSLRAATVFGMLHGLESLAQLLDVFGVPPTARVISGAPVFVEDAPRFSYRGLLVDSARHFLPVPQLLHTIDALAWSKLNVLHWHIVDSSSFPCGSATYPQLAAAGAYDPSAVYSVSDLKTVVAYGKARGVRVVPEWDVPGHGKWGGVPGVMGCYDVLDPTADATYDMLGAFLGEMGTIFEEPMLFLGGDEVDASCWDRNSAIAAWLKSHNMTSAELQQYFWVQMRSRVLPALNKTVGVWEADGLQIDLSSLAAGSFVNVYQSFETANRTTIANKTTVVSIAGDWWYLDQNTCGGYHQDGWACTYDQPLFDTTWTDLQRTFLVGGETAMWGEGINAGNADAYIWRGAAAAAERLWSALAQTPTHQLAAGRFVEHLCRLWMLGVRAGPIGPNFCPADAVMPAAAAASRARAVLRATAPAGDDGSVTLSRAQVEALREALREL